MNIYDEVKEVVLAATVKAFNKEVDEINMNTRFLEDLEATSIQYFPVISALEDRFDIDLQYQDFRRNSKTIEDAINYVVSIVE